MTIEHQIIYPFIAVTEADSPGGGGITEVVVIAFDGVGINLRTGFVPFCISKIELSCRTFQLPRQKGRIIRHVTFGIFIPPPHTSVHIAIRDFNIGKLRGIFFGNFRTLENSLPHIGFLVDLVVIAGIGHRIFQIEVKKYSCPTERVVFVGFGVDHGSFIVVVIKLGEFADGTQVVDA